MTKKTKQLVGIVGTIILVLAVAFGIIFAVKKSTPDVQSLPANSLEVIKVDDPEAFHEDKNDDPHINIDMLGQKIKEADIEVPEVVTKKKDSSDKNKDGKNKDGKNKDKKGNNKDDVVVSTSVSTRRAPTAEEMNQVTNFNDLRFKVPSLGLDISYGMVDEVDGILRPSNFTAAFGVRNIGVNYDQTQNGTAYVVTHTVDEGGLAPGNYFFNNYYSVDNPKIKNGDEIIIENGQNSKKFVVEKHFRQGKAVVMTDQDLWDVNVKNRLAIIICAPNTLDNYVVIARPA